MPEMVEAALADAGFDLVHAFDAQAISREPDLAWLCGAEPRGLLIGNTRALWPVFVRAMADPALATLPDPLEHYTECVLAAAFPGARIYYAHRQYAGAFLPLQRVADATGLGSLAANHLVIHPIHGPW
ncbi:MAG: hypothetical protein ABI867_25190, partial [Kofleriaceae bacterium]